MSLAIWAVVGFGALAAFLGCVCVCQHLALEQVRDALEDRNDRIGKLATELCAERTRKAISPAAYETLQKLRRAARDLNEQLELFESGMQATHAARDGSGAGT